MHAKCYGDYTRICTKAKSSLESGAIEEEQDSVVGKFDKLCEFVRDHIIEQQQSVSIKLLNEVYGLGQRRLQAERRSKTKAFKRVQKRFAIC